MNTWIDWFVRWFRRGTIRPAVRHTRILKRCQPCRLEWRMRICCCGCCVMITVCCYCYCYCCCYCCWKRKTIFWKSNLGETWRCFQSWRSTSTVHTSLSFFFSLNDAKNKVNVWISIPSMWRVLWIWWMSEQPAACGTVLYCVECWMLIVECGIDDGSVDYTHCAWRACFSLAWCSVLVGGNFTQKGYFGWITWTRTRKRARHSTNQYRISS